MHGAEEAPGLWQQLANSCGLHLCEELSSMHTASDTKTGLAVSMLHGCISACMLRVLLPSKVRGITKKVDLVSDDGVACHLHLVQACARHQVACR